MTKNIHVDGIRKYLMNWPDLIRWDVLTFTSAAMAVTAGCLMPARWLPLLPNDKLLHFLAFAMLTFLAGQFTETYRELLFWSAGLFCAGWAIEALQAWIPGRSFCWRDLVANTAGIAAAFLGVHLLR
jgi:uncharacterized protein YfiM (DUF2279 family)